VRDLVAASGTNLASIGYHFGSKEALLTTAMSEAIGEWGNALEQVLAAEHDPAASPIERFEATWTRVIETFAAYRPVWVASFEALVQAERSPEVRAAMADAVERARVGLSTLFQTLEEPVAEHTARTVGSFHQALLSAFRDLVGDEGAEVAARWVVRARRGARAARRPGQPAPVWRPAAPARRGAPSGSRRRRARADWPAGAAGAAGSARRRTRPAGR
jgi:AcrR family transcriptional regulator